MNTISEVKKNAIMQTLPQKQLQMRLGPGFSCKWRLFWVFFLHSSAQVKVVGACAMRQWNNDFYLNYKLSLIQSFLIPPRDNLKYFLGYLNP